MAVNDFFKVTTRGAFLLQQIVNTFFYTAGEGVAMSDATTFATNFLSVVFAPCWAMVSSQWAGVDLEVQDLDPAGVDFHFDLSGAGGTVSSADDLPAFACWSFLLHRTNRSTFNGHKRLAGVPEAWQTNGEIASGHSTVLAAAVAALSANVSDGTHDFQPVIVSKILNGVARAAPLGNAIAFATFKGITTQNTRKPGRGA